MSPAKLRASRIDAEVRKLSGATMGTGWSLSFAAPDSVTNSAVVAALEDTFSLIIRQMSGWEHESDLCRFNRAKAGWHELPEEFFKVLKRALEIAELTNGAYDPALGAKVDALGFGPTPLLSSRPERSGEPGPTDQRVPSLVDGSRIAQRASGMTSTGWRDIKLDAENRAAFQPGDVTLDLSSIAKGHAVDLCAARLKALAIPSFLMEIGGEFAGEGVKPDGNPWWVGLELSDQPPAPDEPKHTDVALVGLALATSGDFVRRREGVSHLLDGRTGETVANTLSGVSVLHASAMEADGWATALFALGPEAGIAMADAQSLAAVFATRNADGARLQLSRKASEMLG